LASKVSTPVQRFRFHGLRKLNWAARGWNVDYATHLRAEGLDRWIETAPTMIVVGPNAGGKSTIIDLFRALADAAVWPSLQRENYPGADFSGFDLEGDDFSLSGRFSKYTPETEQMFDWSTVFAFGRRDGLNVVESTLASKYAIEGDWLAPIQSLLDAIVHLSVRHLGATGPLLSDDLDDAELSDLLNELSPHFPSVYANDKLKPFVIFKGEPAGPGRIGILFKDDTSQHGFVHRRALPLGWLQLVSVLAFLRGCRKGALILLDEPDRHLHPSLQRVMIELVERERNRLDAQVVIATHSSVLINPELVARVGAKVIVAARGRCEELPDARRVLDDLGVTSGDLVQANGLVWVEGPSDRIYIKTWIERLANMRGEPAPIERVHYAFVNYGGSLLKHLSLTGEDKDRLELAAVNRNFFIIVDRDLPTGSPEGLAREKQRVLDEANFRSRAPEIWITQGYTIESYLPAGWEGGKGHVETTENGRTQVVGISKVELAERYARFLLEWDRSFLPGSDAPERVAALLNKIWRWQTPQEDIEPDFLPPYLRED
jgi:energy-coupling factor transporter ATP-binding protein EcfA2